MIRTNCLVQNGASAFANYLHGFVVPCTDSGFDAGVCFLTPMMTPHGVSAASTEGFNAAVQAGDPKINRPKRLSDDSIWIMFESCAQLCVTNWAASNTSFRDVA